MNEKKLVELQCGPGGVFNPPPGRPKTMPYAPESPLVCGWLVAGAQMVMRKRRERQRVEAAGIRDRAAEREFEVGQ